MEIKKKIVVPTGEIYTAIGEKGMLEFLTVGDYGKNANIKADFLGITRDLHTVRLLYGLQVLRCSKSGYWEKCHF